MDKIIIDFEVINTNNPKTLLIGDTSKWLHAKDKPSFINITLPGYTKSKPFTFKKDSMQVFNSHNLGLTEFIKCVDEQEYIDLPDGVYTFLLESGYENIEKKRYYLKTDTLKLELAKFVTKNLLEYSKSDVKVMDAVQKIKWNIYLAESFTIQSDIAKATIYYNEAVDSFKEITC